MDLECELSDLFQAAKISHGSARGVNNGNRTPGVGSFASFSLEDANESCEFPTRDGQIDELLGRLFFDALGSHTETISTVSRVPRGIPSVSSFEGYLLQHYIDTLSVFLINCDSPSNPLRSVILPRAAASPILMNALCALSSWHIFACNQASELRVAALDYYSKATSALYHLLHRFNCYSDVGDCEIALLTSVFLCKYEIISGGVSNWRPHLQGIGNLLRAFPHAKSKLSQETITYIQSL
jgi:hypothetical protein